MSKTTRQNSGKAAVTGNDEKVFSVRVLKDLNDVARLQARIMRAYLKGEISGELFKNVMYGSRCMTHTMSAISPTPDKPLEVRIFGDVDLGSYPGVFGSGTTVEECNEAMRALSEES